MYDLVPPTEARRLVAAGVTPPALSISRTLNPEYPAFEGFFMPVPKDPLEWFFLQKGFTRRQLEAMELYFWEQMSVTETARRLFVSEATVNDHLRLAAEKLEKVLGTTVSGRADLRRWYIHSRSQVVWTVNWELAPNISCYEAEHAAHIEDVVGEVLVLYQSPGLRGLRQNQVNRLAVHKAHWLLPPDVRRLAETPLPGEEGDDGAKWALSDIDKVVSDIREKLTLHVRPLRYFQARRTNDRLDQARVGKRTLREAYWNRAVPLHESPLANILVAHVVVIVTARDASQFLLFTRRVGDPRIVAYERGAWAPGFEEQYRGDPELLPGTAHRPVDRSVFDAALRGLEEELGVQGAEDLQLLSVMMEWANGYTGCVIRLDLDLRSRKDLSEPEDVERFWKLKHQDREADAVTLVPFSPQVLVPLVFEGADPNNLLPPAAGGERQLHRTAMVRVYHALASSGRLTADDLRRVERTLKPFRHRSN
jgi:ADP-ribose pyrophosphatase YjhB (NUDIX family)